MPIIVKLIVLSALHALLMTLSFSPFNLPIIAWVSIVPFFYGVLLAKHSTVLLVAFALLSALFSSAFAFHWMVPTFQLALQSGLLGSVALFLIFAIASSLKTVLFSIFLGGLFNAQSGSSLRLTWLGRLPINWLTVGFIGLVVEWLSPTFIPWHWGNLIASNKFLLQIVEITGINGLSFLIVAGNFLVFQWLMKSSKILPTASSLKEQSFSIPSFSLLIIFCMTFGFIRLDQISNDSLPTTTVAALQPNSPLGEVNRQMEIRDDVFRVIGETIPAQFEQLFKQQARIDVVILPEAVVPFSTTKDNAFTRNWGLYSEPFERTIQNLAVQYNAEIYLGELTVFPGSDVFGVPIGQPKNSFVGYARNGMRGPSYQKNILFPMGEYVPFVETVKKLKLDSLLPAHLLQAQFYPGDGKELLPYSLAKQGDEESEAFSRGAFLPLICYEVLFPQFTREFFSLANRPTPDFIVNITQDGWFRDSLAPHQHLELARIRTVETRRAMVRSANSGVSVLYGVDGQAINPIIGKTYTGLGEETYQVWKVPVNRQVETLFVSYGYLWIGLLFMIVVGNCALSLIQFRSVRSPSYSAT